MADTTNERHLRSLVAPVKVGKMSRRVFVRKKMVELGLTAPLASQLLAYAGVAAEGPAVGRARPGRQAPAHGVLHGDVPSPIRLRAACHLRG